MRQRVEIYLRDTLKLPEETIKTIVCQAAHESNYWTSNVFQHSNNMFGMKTHNRKVKYKNDNSLNYKGYATYTDFRGSLEDIKDWLQRTKCLVYGSSIIEYAHQIRQKGYYEASEEEYREGMLRAYRRFYPESAHKYN